MRNCEAMLFGVCGEPDGKKAIRAGGGAPDRARDHHGSIGEPETRAVVDDPAFDVLGERTAMDQQQQAKEQWDSLHMAVVFCSKSGSMLMRVFGKNNEDQWIIYAIVPGIVCAYAVAQYSSDAHDP